MKIKAGWTKREKGWTLRYNQLIDYLNENADPDRISPKLTKEERDWYEKSAAQLKEENDKIAEECKAKGIKPWKTSFGKMELDF